MSFCTSCKNIGYYDSAEDSLKRVFQCNLNNKIIEERNFNMVTIVNIKGIIGFIETPNWCPLER